MINVMYRIYTKAPALLVAGAFALLQTVFSGDLRAQDMGAIGGDFISFQKSFKRVSDAFNEKEAVLKGEFQTKGLPWPAKSLYLRNFKYDGKLEAWIQTEINGPYKLFKTYNVCALAGNLGPKRFEGDYQVPEGFYYVNEFRPNSAYHMALGVNYPNASDKLLSDPKKPGGAIYIHGSCVTVGCIPITDELIKELYVLAATVKDQGNDFIPIHVMPISFLNDRSQAYLDEFLVTRPEYKNMVTVMEDVYHYFNQYRKIPVILVNSRGEYVLGQDYKINRHPKKARFTANTEERNRPGKFRDIPADQFFTFVNDQPKYPGGMEAFTAYVNGVADKLGEFIPDGGPKRLYIDVEFVIDKDGEVVNVKPGTRANNEMNNRIIEEFEKMPNWQPALRQDKPVPIRLTQNLVVEAKPQLVKKVSDEYDYYNE